MIRWMVEITTDSAHRMAEITTDSAHRMACCDKQITGCAQKVA